MAQESENAQAFARRLVELMKLKRKISSRSRSGVDVSALSKAAGVSYEMARRYVEGMALPRPDTVEAIGKWLEVPAASLAWGDQGNHEQVDPLLLEQALQAVADAQEKARIQLSTDQAAKLVAQLYTEAKAGQRPSTSSLVAMLRAFFLK